jgi:hypothetical protein
MKRLYKDFVKTQNYVHTCNLQRQFLQIQVTIAYAKL